MGKSWYRKLILKNCQNFCQSDENCKPKDPISATNPKPQNEENTTSTHYKLYKFNYKNIKSSQFFKKDTNNLQQTSCQKQCNPGGSRATSSWKLEFYNQQKYVSNVKIQKPFSKGQAGTSC